MQSKFSTERLLWLSVLVNVVLVCGAYLLSEHGFFGNKPDSLTPHWNDNKTGEKGVVIDKPWEFVVNYPVDFDNATAIFNSVQGALKQKDDNMHPVGVTFIPAYIPPNTLMYHSTSDKNIPDLFEWIAFDYEFSYDFAHVVGNHRGGHGPGGPKGPGGPGGPGGPPGGPGGPPPAPAKRDEEGDDVTVAEEKKHAFMYTFKNTKAFDKILLLDGASAAKSMTGEMDQQFILSKMEDPTKRVDEREAAKVICKWGESFGLQGFIRLEIGYEMILCDFVKDVDFVSNVTLGDQFEILGFPVPKENASSEEKRDEAEVSAAEKDLAAARTSVLSVTGAMAGIEHIQAGHRVDDGESRIQLDFSKMVTPLNKTYIDPNPYYRRINNISESLKDDIILELEKHFSGEGARPFGKTNWQLITNQVVEKFTPILLGINNTLLAFEYNKNTLELGANLNATAGNLTKSTYNFVRRYTQSEDARDKNADVKELAFQASALDWVYHTFPLTTSSEALIYSSIYEVYVSVFNIIYESFEVSKVVLQDIVVEPSVENQAKNQKLVEDLKLKVNTLVKNLRWGAFTRCSTVCGWDEACYVPTWGPGPLGWGGDNRSQWYEFDGNRYVVGNELKCVNFKDLIKH